MKIVLKMMLVLGILVLVGCGGGGGTSTENGENGTSGEPAVAYVVKKLPVIKLDTIPDVLLNKSSSNSKKINKQFKEIGEISSGYTTLKEKAAFFYKKQLQMNMELGYMDSIWEQIESYCQGEENCSIPSKKITFTYTKALYERDVKLITEYEEKTKTEYQNDGITKDDLKTIIGVSVKLASATLIISDDAEYKYVLSTEQLGDQEENPNLERSIVKWNDDDDNYFIREEVEGTIDGKSSGKPDWIQFEYVEIGEEKISKFTTTDTFWTYTNETLEFKEKEDGSIYFIQDNPSDDISYHAEGSLSEDGGKMTFSNTEGYYSHETFDKDGEILTTISCDGAIEDLDNITDTDSCSIQDPSIIKSILLENIYSLEPPFWDVNNALPTSSPEHQTMLKFDENNSMLAIVDCATFVADYKVEEYGISFSNIKKTISTTLKCLYPQIQDNFEKVLNDGLPFMHAVDDPVKGNSHFSTLFGFFPNLDNVSRTDFDLDKFYEKLNAGVYVDSPLMNSVFEIKSVQEYAHQENGQNYLLRSSPQIKVENGKMIIDLIDATFEASIEVVDPTHIKFVNINRENKSDVTYPDDVNNTCVEENSETEDECMGDPYTDSTNSDKIFASIIEQFLSETIEVSSGVTGYSRVTFVGSGLAFNGSIIPPEPVIIPLILSIGENNTTSVYSPHGAPIVLEDRTTNITTVIINKEGNIELQGADADLFTLANGQLSFAVEVNASKPMDANEDGIYELEIKATDADGKTIRYDVWYKVLIPGTIIVLEIQDMLGVWDFSTTSKPKHYFEILQDGSMKVHDYNVAEQCFSSGISGIAIKKGNEVGVFIEYAVDDNIIFSEYTAEIRNDIFIRTHVNNFSELPKIQRAIETSEYISNNGCTK